MEKWARAKYTPCLPFAHYSEELHGWTVTPGSFAIEIGKNAHEILLSETIRL